MPNSLGAANPGTLWVGSVTFIDALGQTATISVKSTAEITQAELDALCVSAGAVSKCDIIGTTRSETKGILPTAATVTDADASVQTKGVLTFQNGLGQVSTIAIPGLAIVYVDAYRNIDITATAIAAIETDFLAMKNDGLSGANVYDLVAGTYNARSRKSIKGRTKSAETTAETDDSGTP